MTRTRKPNNNSETENTNLEGSEPLPAQTEALAVEPVDAAVASGVDRLMEVIEKTVETVGSDDAERQMLRQGVTTIVQDTLLDFLRPQEGDLSAASMGLVAPVSEARMLTTEGDTTNTALDSAVRGSQQVGMAFVDFTQGLITGTFNSIIKATIDQMKAYSEMVADITKSLKEFASDNVSEDAVQEKLAQLTFTEASNGKETAFAVKKDQPRRAYHLKRLYYLAPITGGHRVEILKVFGLERLVENGVINEKEAQLLFDSSEFDQVGGISANGSTSYLAADLVTIQAAIKHGLARDGMNQLRQMAREGMARIVITEGEINTKLIFQVSSSETNTSRTTNTNRSSFGGSVRGGAYWGWGSASMNAYYNQLNVSTVDQTSVGNIETLTQMSGQVILKFKTDYKPLNDGTGTVKESDLAPII
ncbi:hypothetical protein [Pseudanabaena sp. FACHB-2040]|uniref:hypothetical protein n=1 Tax=Pseudanabaena sp. FACHB-2040 TaxID=2692859 RepID=UPI0016828ED2|nr:hypothetical protein [Pseudanabaena sp. FACHB-2040]MBD2259441.1 hypothetical protein [Pseudanabaena sp. FACHB-2040]